MSFVLDTGIFTYNCVNCDNFVTNNYYVNASHITYVNLAYIIQL